MGVSVDGVDRGLRPECWNPPSLEGWRDEGSSRGEAMASEEGRKP